MTELTQYVEVEFSTPHRQNVLFADVSDVRAIESNFIQITFPDLDTGDNRYVIFPAHAIRSVESFRGEAL